MWKVSQKYEDFSCCHRNNDQSCGKKKPRKALLSLPARLFFMKSIVSRPLEDYFSLLSLLFLWGIEIAIVWNGLAWHSKHFRLVSFLTLFLLFGSHLSSHFPSGGWAHIHMSHICRPAPWGCCDRNDQLRRLYMRRHVSTGPHLVFVSIKPRKVQPSMKRHIHVCDHVHVQIRNSDTHAHEHAHVQRTILTTSHHAWTHSLS